MQKLQLSIPQPCHENWQNMTPTEQGRFCNACAKEVVDFSTMTDIQVLNYFSTLTHQKVCGRALPEQLNRTISRPDTPKKKLFWYWNYIVMFFIFFGKGNAAKAQGDIRPVTEVSPLKPNAIRIRGQMLAEELPSRVITGKVNDKDGNPVSFASIKIKGTNTGVSADANGVYSMRVKIGAVLEVTSAGFKPVQILSGTESILNIVLEQDKNISIGETIVVIVGAISRNPDEYYGPQDKSKRVAVLQVKDELTGKSIPSARLIVRSNYTQVVDTITTDKKGMYKIKGIEEDEVYEIKISASGYEQNEFSIDENDFNDRKNIWEVFLKKQKKEITMPVTESKKRLGGMVVLKEENDPLYIVDGEIIQNWKDINPNDIEDITVLQAAAATALFGPDGVNGAIVITTKKHDFKNLDTLVLSASKLTGILVHKKITTTTTSNVMGGMVAGVTIKAGIKDTLINLATRITGAINVYPNPVQRGEQFNLALKIKLAGQYHLQIIDAAGSIVLQKHINAIAKDLTEKIIADARWSSGLYYISIYDNKNKLINKNSFIVR